MQPIRSLHAERLISIAILVSLSAACAASYERNARSRLASGKALWPGERATERAEQAPPTLDGSLDGYLAAALRAHPELEAAFETWRAAVHSIAVARRVPEPSISYGFFVRNVETRVGPQRHRFSVKQMMPWPARLRAGADAAAGRARAAERAFETQVLAVRRRVADAYWSLWLARRSRAIHVDHKQLLSELSESIRARIAIGRASLADVNQLDLRVTRMDDAIAALAEDERKARAALLAAADGPRASEAPTTEPAPRAMHADEPEDTLRAAALAHPRIRELAELATASDDRVRVAETQGLPELSFGVDYIETGPAAAADMPDSGKDPVIVSVGISIPLWRNSYAAEADAARASAAALRARGEAAALQADSELADALSHVRDSGRRIELYEHTLIPQADNVYDAVVGAYQAGDASLAALLLAQEDVLELRLQLASAQANHARAWAHLEHVVGREVAAKELRHD